MTRKELKNILYAEDEGDIRAIAQVALEDIGSFHLYFCANGQEVLELLKTFTPDLILLDVMMPGMDGPTTLCELRKIEHCADIPAMFMTAKVQTKEIEAYKALGVIDVLAKPFDPMTLADRIKNSWLKHYEQ